MLRLHYFPGGHGSHDFGHRGRNGVTVTQRRRTGSTNVARRGCHDRQGRFLNSQKICHGSHGGIDLLIPLFHTGPESHELTRIDKYLDSWLNRTPFVMVLTDSHSP